MSQSKLKVLSLFDGISCGRIALERAGLKIDTYYASEIDKYAIQTAQKNYPDIIQLGDVKHVVELVKSGVFSDIDLLIGGSPCQGFSFAGKQLNFSDPRSSLFFQYAEILNELKQQNPNVKFLLENVKMKKDFQDIISNFLGVKPVEINSSLVSAQNRIRLYWCNWKITQPEDKGILLKDIIENGFVDRDKSLCLLAGYNDKFQVKRYFEKHIHQAVFEKSGKIRKLTPIECERLQTLPDNYTFGVPNAQRYKQLGNGWTVDVITHIFKELLA